MLLNLLIRQALVLCVIYFYLPMHSTMEILSYRKSYQFSDPLLFFKKQLSCLCCSDYKQGLSSSWHDFTSPLQMCGRQPFCSTTCFYTCHPRLSVHWVRLGSSDVIGKHVLSCGPCLLSSSTSIPLFVWSGGRNSIMEVLSARGGDRGGN